jgi:hypothetical protein
MDWPLWWANIYSIHIGYPALIHGTLASITVLLSGWAENTDRQLAVRTDHWLKVGYRPIVKTKDKVFQIPSIFLSSISFLS